MQMNRFLNLWNKSTRGFAILALVWIIVSVLPLPWNQPVENAIIDSQFKIRGPRPLPDDFVLVFIGQEDLQALGHWPITRDYYGYLIHVLTQLGARTVGIDVLFDAPDTRYPEYDSLLVDFLTSAKNVFLPFIFSDFSFSENGGGYAGETPVFPIAIFEKAAAGLGFANLSNEVRIRTAPLSARYQNKRYLAFGAQLARHYLAPPRAGQKESSGLANLDSLLQRQNALRLNHFGSTEHVTAISFVELLQGFKNASVSIDFSGKLVLIAPTAPGLPVLKATPLAALLPASLLHLTVAENLIRQNYLRPAPAWLQPGLVVILMIIMLIALRGKRTWLRAASSLLGFAGYWAVTQYVFAGHNLVLPVFYPTLAAASVIIFHLTRERRAAFDTEATRRAHLQREIDEKTRLLASAEKRLAGLQQELQREREEKHIVSETSQARIAEYKKTVIDLQKQLRDLRAFTALPEAPAPEEFFEIVHAPGSRIAEILVLVRKVAPDTIPVLLQGETGTGKELIARAIHRYGPRKTQPFIAVNCGALPETLLESELFGHEKGSFTGAFTQRKGRFELADGGTLFLDEITETSPAFQARLLRVLQEGTFERVGGERSLHVDVRVIAASSKNLHEEVGKGTFREDLFYRLHGFPIDIPPLRERQADIPVLAAHFLKKHAYVQVRGISEEAMHLMQLYAWPGNVRELENVVRRAAILAGGEGRKLIQVSDLPAEMTAEVVAVPEPVAFQSLDEQILISLRRLQFSHAAISRTAKLLGNRDRGTITEYLRGMCFQFLVENDFEIGAAAQALAGTEEPKIVQRVQAKIKGYLQHLPRDLPAAAFENRATLLQLPAFKGLPKRYHEYLVEVLQWLGE